MGDIIRLHDILLREAGRLIADFNQTMRLISTAAGAQAEPFARVRAQIDGIRFSASR